MNVAGKLLSQQFGGGLTWCDNAAPLCWQERLPRAVHAFVKHLGNKDDTITTAAVQHLAAILQNCVTDKMAEATLLHTLQESTFSR